MPLTWQSDTGSEATLVTVRGRPDAQSVTALTDMLGRHAVGRAGDLLLDLSRIEPAEWGALPLAGLTSRRMMIASGAAVLLRGPRSPAPATMHQAERPVPLGRHLARALKALTAGPLTSPFFTEDLLPVTGAARRSRDVVTAACLTWGCSSSPSWPRGKPPWCAW